MTSDDNIDPASAITRLERCLEALTATDTEQQPLFPEEQSSPETLAAAFDRALAAVQRIAGDALTPEQRDALDSVSEKLLLISQDGAEFDADVWTEGAVRTSAHWHQVRTLAAAALETLRPRV